MGEPAMKLEKEQLEQIGEYVKKHLPEWIKEPDVQMSSTGSAANSSKTSHTIDLSERMVRVEEGLLKQQELMKQGFDMMEKRFDAMQTQMDKRFDAVQTQMDKRFEQVDKRFATLQWFMGIGMTLLMGLITLFQYV